MATSQTQQDEGILVPSFTFRKAEEFYGDRVDEALAAVEAGRDGVGYDVVFMPGLVDSRIGAPKEARVWQEWFSAPSVRLTGRTKQGSRVVVHGHVPNYLSKSENVTTVIGAGLRNGAGLVPQGELDRLVALEDGESVFVTDYAAWQKAPQSGTLIGVDDAVGHPETIPFLGGRSRAERYLPRHQEVFGNRVRVYHADDLDEQGPRGRVLALGYVDSDDLSGDVNLYDFARFVGVRRLGAPQAHASAQRGPTIEAMLRVSADFVPKAAREAFEQQVRSLYK